MKTCSECKIEQPLDEFYLCYNKNMSKSYHWSVCKTCNRIKRKHYRKAYYERNKDALKQQNIARRYGLSPEQYRDMIANGCEVCGKKEPEVKLCVDHDHSCCPGQYTCGKCVRGILCSSHNMILGQMKDNHEHLQAMAKYIRKITVWPDAPNMELN